MSKASCLPVLAVFPPTSLTKAGGTQETGGAPECPLSKGRTRLPLEAIPPGNPARTVPAFTGDTAMTEFTPRCAQCPSTHHCPIHYTTAPSTTPLPIHHTTAPSTQCPIHYTTAPSTTPLPIHYTSAPSTTPVPHPLHYCPIHYTSASSTTPLHCPIHYTTAPSTLPIHYTTAPSTCPSTTPLPCYTTAPSTTPQCLIHYTTAQYTIPLPHTLHHYPSTTLLYTTPLPIHYTTALSYPYTIAPLSRYTSPFPLHPRHHFLRCDIMVVSSSRTTLSFVAQTLALLDETIPKVIGRNAFPASLFNSQPPESGYSPEHAAPRATYEAVVAVKGSHRSGRGVGCGVAVGALAVSLRQLALRVARTQETGGAPECPLSKGRTRLPLEAIPPGNPARTVPAFTGDTAMTEFTPRCAQDVIFQTPTSSDASVGTLWSSERKQYAQN
nr:mucin-5AC-like [Penaeus vannamei]